MLALPANTESHAWVTPRLDFGYEHTYPSGISLRPHVRVGLQYYLGSADTEVRAGFADAPAGADDLFLPIELGQGSRQVAAGLELVSRRGFSVELEYENISASRLSTDTGTIKATIPF